MKSAAFLTLIACGLFFLTCAKVVWNTFHDSEDDPSQIFSTSAAEAEHDGILISRLATEFARNQPDNQSISISEAWIEKCAVHRYSMIWFHRRVPTGGFTIVIKLNKRIDPSFSLWPPEGKSSFGWIGGTYFVRYFESAPSFPMILEGGRRPNPHVPVLTLIMPQEPQ